MLKNIKIVIIDYHYCDYLRQYDNRVPYNYGSKRLRPFIGILFEVNKCEYFAPLSSPKEKHINMKNNIDIIKISGGRLGVINFNNMLPVQEGNYELFNLNIDNDNKEDNQRKILLQKQLIWMNKNENKKNIRNKSSKLYELYKNGRLAQRIKSRCCNFPLLEEKCLEYNKKH
jgi:protein AbiQ